MRTGLHGGRNHCILGKRDEHEVNATVESSSSRERARNDHRLFLFWMEQISQENNPFELSGLSSGAGVGTRIFSFGIGGIGPPQPS